MTHFKSCSVIILTVLATNYAVRRRVPSWSFQRRRVSMPAKPGCFRQNIAGPGSNAVTWTVEPAGFGTVTSSGLYSPPPAIPRLSTVIVRAVSVADPTKSDSAVVTLNPLSVIVSPGNPGLWAGRTQQFRATVQKSNNTAITWSLNPPNLGSISATGLYAPPVVILAQTTVTVTAKSVADPTKSDFATITLMPLIIQITPRRANLSAGQTNDFNALIRRTNNTAVNWSISPPSGQPRGSASTAPSNNGRPLRCDSPVQHAPASIRHNCKP